MSSDVVTGRSGPAPGGGPAADARSSSLTPHDEGSFDFRALAERHGLTVSGARPPLREYLAQIWGRRHFILAFSRAKMTAQYSKARLGQVWLVATPLLNALVYYLVFGVLLGTRHDVPDYVPFLVTGVFMWTFTQATVTAGVKAVSGNVGLIRALHFPRASLPLALCLQQLQQLLYSLIVLFAVLLAFGVLPNVNWLLAVPVLALQSVFNAGLALAFARLGSRIPDLAQMMPFVLRTWMYVSGVMYSITDKAKHLPEAIQPLLPLNPAAVYLDLMRFTLIDSFGAERLPPHAWLAAVLWSLVIGVGGFVFFWTAEERYGRD